MAEFFAEYMALQQEAEKLEPTTHCHRRLEQLQVEMRLATDRVPVEFSIEGESVYIKRIDWELHRILSIECRWHGEEISVKGAHAIFFNSKMSTCSCKAVGREKAFCIFFEPYTRLFVKQGH